MNDKAVFFATMGMVGSKDCGAESPSSPALNSEEWKALRLLTLAGYTIVLFTSDRAPVYAECQEAQRIGGTVTWPAGSPGRRREHVSKQVTPLLQATEKLNLDLNQSWMVGDRLDSIEAGRLVGCKTVLLTDGNETEWDMSAMRWPDMIAGDLWEIACLIVMSDGSSVQGLTMGIDDED